jgi:hypothetical protein
MIEYKHQQAFVVIILLLSLFVFGLVYVILSKPMQVVYDYTYNDSAVQDQDYQTFFIRSVTVWENVLVFGIISLLIWAIIEIQRKKEMGEF